MLSSRPFPSLYHPSLLHHHQPPSPSSPSITTTTHPLGIYTNQFDYALNVKSGFPVFSTMLEAVHVGKRGAEFESAKLTDEDKAEIHTLARDPRIGAFSTCL